MLSDKRLTEYIGIALQEVSMPPRQPQVPPAKFGFNDYAERINSRACMVRKLTDSRQTVMLTMLPLVLLDRPSESGHGIM